jgi:hypothetical protein
VKNILLDSAVVEGEWSASCSDGNRHAMKAYGGVDVRIYILLGWAIVGGEWSASRSDRNHHAMKAYGGVDVGIYILLD